VERDALTDAVGWAAKNLPNRPSAPVLAGTLLRADGQLVVSSFDYEVSTETTTDAKVDAAGSVLVSGRLLAEITKALPNKPVDIAAVGTHLELVCGSARFTLPTMPVEDYPTLPDMPAAAGIVDAAVFAQAVAQVAVAAGRDETLPMMTGVRIEVDGMQVTLLATDRYRLAMREVEWKPEQPGVWDALIPASTLAGLAKTMAAAGTVTIARNDGGPGEGMLGFAAAGRRTTSRLLDGGNYPPVRALFPASHNADARVSVPALAEVVKRVALVAERTTPVLLTFAGDGLVVEAGGSEDARASEAMDATFTGDPLTIAFNPQYLLDGLAAVNAPTAVFQIVDAFKPAVLVGADPDGATIPAYRYLIMPIRVSR
jgi:DNA polymerase-3 subunit beta